jgi:hypothetical protein
MPKPGKRHLQMKLAADPLCPTVGLPTKNSCTNLHPTWGGICGEGRTHKMYYKNSVYSLEGGR